MHPSVIPESINRGMPGVECHYLGSSKDSINLELFLNDAEIKAFFDKPRILNHIGVYRAFRWRTRIRW